MTPIAMDRGFTITAKGTVCSWRDGSTDCENIPQEIMILIAESGMHFNEDINITYLKGDLEGPKGRFITVSLEGKGGDRYVFTITDPEVWRIIK